jgi:radical SAM protein with 4Fe4S-binding SPASM domain
MYSTLKVFLMNYEISINKLREKLNRSDMCILSKEGKFLLLDIKPPQWREISIFDALVVRCLQDGCAAEKLFKMLCFFGMAPVEAEQYIKKFTARASEVTHTGVQSQDHSLTVFLHLTNRCNLSCIYCYTKSIPGNHCELDTHRWADVLAQVAQVAQTIVFTGGEPLLRSDTLELARIAREKGLTTKLITNGTLITPSKGQDMAQVFDSVQISVDGPERIHNRTRGCYHATFAALQTMCSSPAVQVGITVTQYNINEIIQFIHSLNLKGVERIHLNLLKSAHMQNTRLHPSIERLGTLLETLFHADFNTVTNFNHIVPPRGDCSLNCGAGSSVITLMPNGDVYPCEGLIRPSLYAGNILETPLHEIIDRAPTLEQLRKITVDEIEGCRDCPYRYLCGGGCRADALNSGGTLQAIDPNCPLHKQLIESFIWKYRRWIP